MPKKNPEQFDGQFALMTDGDKQIRPDTLRLYYLNPDLFKFEQINPLFVRFIVDCTRHRFWESELSKMPWEPDVKVNFVHNFVTSSALSAEIEDLKRNNQKLCDLIQNGRLQFSVLLNSYGGSGRTFPKIAEHVKYNKGEIITFGGRIVGSAAAEALLLAKHNRRFISPTSKLMFHLPPGIFDEKSAFEEEIFDDEEINENKEKLIREYKGKLKNKLLQAAIECRRDEMGLTIENAFNTPKPDEPDCPIELSADQAEYFGIAKKQTDIGKKFLQLNRVSRSAIQGTKLGLFFTAASKGILPEVVEVLSKHIDF